MRKRNIAVVGGLLILGLLAAGFETPAAGARPTTISRRRLAPGVVLKTIRNYSVPWRIRVVSIDLSRASTIDVALAQDRLPGFETTSSMARRHGALVAVNGDYALPSGRPVFTLAEDGRLAQTATLYGRNFAVDKEETQTYIGHPRPRLDVIERETGAATVAERVNAGAPGRRQAALFSPAAGYLEQPPRDSCSARLRAREPFHLSDAASRPEALFEVADAACTGPSMARNGGSVVSTPLDGAWGPQVASLERGEEVALSWTLGWPRVMDTVGGNPTLVRNGRIDWDGVAGSGGYFERHPRTAVGVTGRGTVLLVTVDGRQRRHSAGMTLGELARFMKRQGAESALNLDGGGSTTMVVDGRVVNRPSDGRERAVSSALMLLPGPDRGEPDYVRPTTHSASHWVSEDDPVGRLLAAGPSPAEAVWSVVARDPASTGGLAATLHRRGVDLGPALRRAARLVGRR